MKDAATKTIFTFVKKAVVIAIIIALFMTSSCASETGNNSNLPDSTIEHGETPLEANENTPKPTEGTVDVIDGWLVIETDNYMFFNG